MTCFVQYVPYRLTEGIWDSRGELGDRVVPRIRKFAPNLPGAVLARLVLTPLDLERAYRLTEGNIFHCDIQPGERTGHADVEETYGHHPLTAFADHV